MYVVHQREHPHGCTGIVCTVSYGDDRACDDLHGNKLIWGCVEGSLSGR